MNTPTLGEPRFASSRSHTVSDDIHIPERIEPGKDPGLQFELAGPRPKLFFDAKKTRAGIVTCGGLCPGLNNVIRSLVLELHYGYGVRKFSAFAAATPASIHRPEPNRSSSRPGASMTSIGKAARFSAPRGAPWIRAGLSRT